MTDDRIIPALDPRVTQRDRFARWDIRVVSSLKSADKLTAAHRVAGARAALEWWIYRRFGWVHKRFGGLPDVKPLGELLAAHDAAIKERGNEE